MAKNPIAIDSTEIPTIKTSVYPEPFASMMKGREKCRLGDQFGITKFGVNLTKLAPGSRSALLHQHSLQEEFIYILEGNPTLVTDTQQIELKQGMCAGFIPNGAAHYLLNKTSTNVLYLEVGDRDPLDRATYPEDDLVAISLGNNQWEFKHKDGSSY